MSNLSDLLPAGAGAKSATFTASGTLPSGEVVVLNTNGTVSSVTQTSASTGTPVSFNAGSSRTSRPVAVVYHPVQDKTVFFYKDSGASNVGKAIVGTVSGTTISFAGASEYQFENNTIGEVLTAVYDSNIDRIVVVFELTATNYTEAKVVTVSGNTLSFTGGSGIGSTTNYENGTTCFDSVANKIIFAASNQSSSGYGEARVLTATTSSVSSGSPVVFQSNYVTRMQAVYDENADKTVIAYGNSGTGASAIVGTVSGTSISFGTAANVSTAGNDAYNVAAAYDSDNYKVVVAYRTALSANDGNANVGTVSGTDITFGSAVQYLATSADHTAIVYDKSAKKIVIAFCDSNSDGELVEGTVSGDTISFTSPTVFVAASINDMDRACVYDSTAGKTVFAYQLDSNKDEYAFVHQSAATDSADFVGITDEAIADTATGSVVVEGGQVTNSALVAEYLAKDTTEIFESDNVEFVAIAYDSNAQKIVILYTDSSAGDNGTAVVATISNGSISYGTPAVFNNAGTTNISAAYDSTAQKIVVAFRDGNNSNQGSAVVGTVSGTSISFGSSTIFETGTVQFTSTAYDANADRIVIAYKDQGNSNYGTSVVGTVSGTSISFGTPVVHQSSLNYANSIVYDSNAQKVVLVYTPSGSGQGVVGTVSGTSISYGSPTAYESSGSASTPTIVYDANAQKVVVVYRYSTGKSVVGTVSGTSISFGTAVEFDNNTTVFSAAYNSSSNTVFVSFMDGDNSNYGTIIEGTVSGTSISFGDSLVFEEGVVNYLASAYDANADRVITAFRDEGNSNYGTAATVKLTQDLIVGSTYYVQDDGSLSTTSSSVTAGKAIATNKLLLKG